MQAEAVGVGVGVLSGLGCDSKATSRSVRAYPVGRRLLGPWVGRTLGSRRRSIVVDVVEGDAHPLKTDVSSMT